MPIQSLPSIQLKLRSAAGALVGIAVPALLLGKAALGFTIGAALICFAVAAALDGPAAFKQLLPARATLRTPLFRALVAMLAAWLVSALWTLDPARSPAVWAQCLGVIALAWLLIRFLADDAVAYEAALRAAVAATLAAGIFGCLVSYVEPSLLQLLRNRPAEHVYQVRDILKSFGSALPPAALVAVFAGRQLGGSWRWAGYATLPIALVFAAGVHSNAGLIGFAGAAATLALLFFAARLPRWPARAAVAVPVLVAVAIGGWLLTRLPAPPVTSAQQIRLPTQLIDRHRQVIWGFAVHQALRGPIFGYGLNTAGRVPGAKDEIPLFKGQYVPSHTHNWLIQAWLETGIPGVLTALAALLCLFVSLFAKARHGAPAAWAAIGVTAGVVISWLFNFSLFAGWWQMVFAVLLAIPMAALRTDRGASRGHSLTEADGPPRTGK
ncbi:MAG: O-antigen ligase family protein [Alphaproteobacteria bacterium]